MDLDRRLDAPEPEKKAEEKGEGLKDEGLKGEKGEKGERKEEHERPDERRDELTFDGPKEHVHVNKD